MAMTVDDVLRLLKECAGEGEGIDPGAMEDPTFEDLGYDSLAVMETASRIEQDYGVTIPDDELTEIKSPAALVEVVNATAAARA
jgi:act minimal PKS acyl carrier protein